jgi:hypothetical protein
MTEGDRHRNLNDDRPFGPEGTGRSETNWAFMIINPKWRSSPRIDWSDPQTRPINHCRVDPTITIAVGVGRFNKSHRHGEREDDHHKMTGCGNWSLLDCSER